jgi:predicted metal-dependent peptidase
MTKTVNNDGRYTAYGYKDRSDYLETLADDYGIDAVIVNELAGMLGPSEDFDGLVSEIEDLSYTGMFDNPENREENP